MLKRRRVRAVAAVGAFAVAFGLLTGPGDWPAAAAPSTFTIVGGGYDHGIGMSQYGAHGMAVRGASAGRIISFYYGGALALFRGPLPAAAAALTAGVVPGPCCGAGHATTTSPTPHRRGRTGPGLRGSPPGPTPAAAGPGHLRLVANPEGTDRRVERRQQQRGLWLVPTGEGLVVVEGGWRLRPATPWWRPWSPDPPHQR